MKKVIIIFLTIIVSLVVLPFIIGLITSFSEVSKISGMTSKDFIFPIIMLCFAGFCLVMGIYTNRNKRKIKNEIEKMKKEDGLLYNLYLKHTAGLPISEGLECSIFYFKDKVEIKHNEMKFNLNRNKILDICLKTDVEIQKQYISSSGGAIGGALLFGPVGALIGGRTKQKTIRKASTYLIITYKNNEEIKYIGFDATYSVQKVNKLVNEFKNSINNQTSVVDL